MKRLLLILILTFSLQSWTRAGDISDFKIDDLSIGSSLLDLFSKEEIEENKATYYKDKTYSSISFASLTEEYDQIQVSWKTSDSEYKMVDVTGGIYQDDINNCYNKIDEVKNDLTEFFNIKPTKKISFPNPFGLYTYINFNFNSGDQVTVSCYDYEEKYENYQDIFRIALETKDFRKWLNSDPY